LQGDELRLTGLVADLVGQRLIRKELRGEPQEAEVMGEELAEIVLESGGAEILAELYEKD
jgi:hydroxymethylbilane synthase